MDLLLRRRVRGQTGLIRATLESTADAILVVDSSRNVVTYNQKFVDTAGLPKAPLTSGDGAPLELHRQISECARKAFTRAEETSCQPEAHSDNTIEFKDGRVFSCHSEPHRVECGKCVGRVWGFRDTTERWRFEEDLFRAKGSC